LIFGPSYVYINASVGIVILLFCLCWRFGFLSQAGRSSCDDASTLFGLAQAESMVSALITNASPEWLLDTEERRSCFGDSETLIEPHSSLKHQLIASGQAWA